jgi:hypothetical protein
MLSISQQALMISSRYVRLHVEKLHQLKILLKKYEHMFDGILGEFNMEPISLQIMDTNFKPIHAHA